MRCTIKDIDRVHRVLKHSSIYPNVADDGSPGVDDFTIEPLLSNEGCYILMPNRDTVGMAIPLNSIMYDIHINILPESRGDKGYRAGMEFLGYLFERTPARKLIAYISTLYRNVYDFAFVLLPSFIPVFS